MKRRTRRARSGAALSAGTRVGVLAVACLLVAGCATPLPGADCLDRSAPPTASPLLWRAKRPDTGVLYLLGSVHVGARPAQYSAAVEKAYHESQELVVEIDVTELVEPEIGREMIERGMLEPPTTLRDVISDETLQRLFAFLETRGVQFTRVERMKPWLATLTLVVVELQAAGYDTEHGVDREFIDRASGQLPIRGLETAEQQFALFDRLDYPLQELMLNDALERSDALEGATDGLFEAWQRGDEAALTRDVFSAELDDPRFEAFYDALFYERNVAMSGQLADLARDGRTRFVVLGAGHMLGEQGIPNLLCESGFAVRRIAGGATRS